MDAWEKDSTKTSISFLKPSSIYIYTCEDRASVSTRTNCLFEYEYERLHHLGSVDDPPILKHAFPEQSFPGERGF